VPTSDQFGHLLLWFSLRQPTSRTPGPHVPTGSKVLRPPTEAAPLSGRRSKCCCRRQALRSKVRSLQKATGGLLRIRWRFGVLIGKAPIKPGESVQLIEGSQIIATDDVHNGSYYSDNVPLGWSHLTVRGANWMSKITDIFVSKGDIINRVVQTRDILEAEISREMTSP
jgi:hypothetical protein